MPAERTAEALNPRLAELGLAIERIRVNLVELELDVDRELLDRAALAGESAARWAAASAGIADLWRGLALLDGVLERARALRGGRRRRASQLAPLRDLLDGRSIELSSAVVPLADRVLLEGVEATHRCSPADLIARMSDAFEIARTTVVEIGRVWEALTPRLETGRRLLADTERRAADLGEAARGDLVEAARRLVALGAALSSDPLAVDPDEIDELGVVLEEIRLDLEATAALARDHVARIALARRLLGELRAVARAGHAARAELIVKVTATPTPTPTPAPASGVGALEAALVEIAALADGGAWREARAGLDPWMIEVRAMLSDARRGLLANHAPIEARNQLRGLLDAYQVKAGRLGLIEDPELCEIFARARRALYTAPTDLALVGELVRRCQAALTGPAPRRDS